MTAAGTTIGRYQLLRLLAAGGMGEVYLARVQSAVEGFGALAAVKLLVRNLSANQAFVKMFLDEARIVGKLHHKNIVQVRDVAEYAGQYYMVMEYIPGQNLRELLGDISIQDRPLFEPRLGTELFVDIVGALATAHAEGLVHRDISPNNIMISDEGVPKLIDFGVARALTSASLTSPGTLKGKFGYMAPEYVRAQAYDHRVDIFSIGVVMWETFARRRLFRGTSAAEQLHQLLESEIPRLDDVVPDFPADLATIISGALERDPQRRISSAAMLGDALGEIARSLPVGKDLTLRKWLERRIPGRLEDRRQTDQILLSLPSGAPIPDFGVAYPEAGSLPGTYGFSDAPPGSTGLATVPGVGSATSIRIASGESQQPAPVIAPPAPANRRRIVVLSAIAMAAAVAIWFLARGRGEQPRADPPAEAGSADIAISEGSGSGFPGIDLKLANAHREIGIKAMQEGDDERARKEFEEAMRYGGEGDLPRLLAIVSPDAGAETTPTVAIVPASETPRDLGIKPTVADPTVRAEQSTTTTKTATAKTAPKPAPTKAARPVVAMTVPKASPQKLRDKVGARDPTPTEVATPAPQAPPPTSGALVVVTKDTAQTAVVAIDGDIKGQTPLALPNLAPGDHKLEITIGARVVRSGTISVTAGKRLQIVVENAPAPAEESPKTVAVIPAPAKPEAKAPIPQPVAPAPTPTARVSADGDASAGSRVVAACNACHKRAGKDTFSPRLYAQRQWESFFASGQHDRYVPIGDQINASQMRAARAYLRANAADSAENQGAGIRGD